MFWVLISPLRKTADPPRLSQDHIISIIFQRHGASVARHPVTTIVLSIFFALLLCYPFPFLSVNSPGIPSESKHAWTSARPFSSTGIPADIGIKQAWVQGSYMGALSPPVLREALWVQEALSVPGIGCEAFPGPTYGKSQFTSPPPPPASKNGRERPSIQTRDAFFHSPLLYWNCSRSRLYSDNDVIDTVNREVPLHSSANVTVLWGSVFAGKKISGGRLLAADALVITLFYKLDSGVGEIWDSKAKTLLSDPSLARRYDVFPLQEDIATTSRMYEFRFQPMSLVDNLMLFLSYGLVAAYCISAFRRIPTVKSKSGLFFASVAQAAGSIMASFTLITLFKLPVSHIPREFFPFVVVVIGSENIFRLTSAVLETPAEQSTVQRVSKSVGEVGFLAFVSVTTDIVLLYVIGFFSAPAVKEFCMFAAIALVLDFILHLTFFLAVLSIDVRRLELQDSLEQHDLGSINWGDVRDFSPRRIGRFADLMLRGRNSLSTRLAGSAILIGFLITLNWHFSEDHSPVELVTSMMDIVKSTYSSAVDAPPPMSSMPNNIARTPQSWMKLQDQLTGMEIIRATKPGAHRVLAKVYDPLFFVTKGSNRARSGDMSDFIDLDCIFRHSKPFVMVAIFIVASITLFLNYLLVDDFEDSDDSDATLDKSLVKTQNLIEGHFLDIVKLTASPRGVLASVGLDRRIVVWKLKANSQIVYKDEVVPVCDEQTLWPVMAIVLDQRGEWLAIAPRVGPISIWSVKDATFVKTIPVDLNKQQPSAFFFAPRHEEEQYGPRLIIIRQNGILLEVYIASGHIKDHEICRGLIVSSSNGVSTPPLPLRIATACHQGRLFITAKKNFEWKNVELDIVEPSKSLSPYKGDTISVLPLPVLGMVVCSRNCFVDLVDIVYGTVVQTFRTGQFRPNSLRVFHSERTTCLHCGCPSVNTFSISYTEKDSGQFVMHTFAPIHSRNRFICLRAERDKREKKCVGFESASETQHWLDNVEGWEPTSGNIVVGIRRKEALVNLSRSSSAESSPTRERSSNLRRRHRQVEKPKITEEDEWEAWTMDAHGHLETYAFAGSNSFMDSGLLVSRAGPVCKLGPKSLAVGFGNTIKVLLVGNERYEDECMPTEIHKRGKRYGRLR